MCWGSIILLFMCYPWQGRPSHGGLASFHQSIMEVSLSAVYSLNTTVFALWSTHTCGALDSLPQLVASSSSSLWFCYKCLRLITIFIATSVQQDIPVAVDNNIFINCKIIISKLFLR